VLDLYPIFQAVLEIFLGYIPLTNKSLSVEQSASGPFLGQRLVTKAEKTTTQLIAGNPPSGVLGVEDTAAWASNLTLTV
jgi:hypothetical protein